MFLSGMPPVTPPFVDAPVPGLPGALGEAAPAIALPNEPKRKTLADLLREIERMQQTSRGALDAEEAERKRKGKSGTLQRILATAGAFAQGGVPGAISTYMNHPEMMRERRELKRQKSVDRVVSLAERLGELEGTLGANHERDMGVFATRKKLPGELAAQGIENRRNTIAEGVERQTSEDKIRLSGLEAETALENYDHLKQSNPIIREGLQASNEATREQTLTSRADREEALALRPFRSAELQARATQLQARAAQVQVDTFTAKHIQRVLLKAKQYESEGKTELAAALIEELNRYTEQLGTARRNAGEVANPQQNPFHLILQDAFQDALSRQQQPPQ